MENDKDAKENTSSSRLGAVDYLHIAIIVSLFLYTFYAVVSDSGVTAKNFWDGLLNCLLLASINDIFTYIGAIAFILFGIVGIYDFAYANGLRKILPSFYLRFREEHDEKTAKIMMKTYYEQDIEFIQEYEQERTNRVLQALKIKEPQFHHVRYEIVRARVMPQGTQDEMVEKLKETIYHKDFIIDQSNIHWKKRVYRNVNYFINLYTALYDTELCTTVGGIMAAYIALCFEKDNCDLAGIDYIVIPYGGNLLLGLEVGQCLQKPVIAVQKEPRIQKDKPWDGVYNRKPGGKNHIIILHDVLVTGDRIYQSIEKLPRDTYMVDGLYCLIQYDHSPHAPEKKLHDHGINNIKCLMHTNEDILKKIYKKQG